jgi:hypothetical protein
MIWPRYLASASLIVSHFNDLLNVCVGVLTRIEMGASGLSEGMRCVDTKDCGHQKANVYVLKEGERKGSDKADKRQPKQEVALHGGKFDKHGWFSSQYFSAKVEGRISLFKRGFKPLNYSKF